MDMMEVFRQTYLEESFEGLSVMESGLLALPVGAPDLEQVNTIFRAAHSIKGGSGTFGFSQISGFTHVLETLLDEMRSGKRQVDEAHRTLLLAAVDILRDMLTKLQHNQPIDQVKAQQVQQQLEALLSGARVVVSEISTAIAQQTEVEISAERQTWLIDLIPESDLLKTGNEPIRIVRELENLGEVTAKLFIDQLPALADYDPECLYLHWRFTLVADNISEAQIREVFEWIDGDGARVEVHAQQSDQAAQRQQPVVDTAIVSTSTLVSAAKIDLTGSTGHGADGTKRTAVQQAPAAAQAESSIRVNIQKIDHLVNLVGELVITQSMLSQFGEPESLVGGQDAWLERLREGLVHLERYTRELQESVMNIRMLPMSFAFNRMPRIVHDTSLKLNKKIELVMEGEHTEVDKTVLEQLTDPLVHIIRNSIDHGIEMPADRLAKGKVDTGVVTLSAFHQGGSIIIQIADDGAGINLAKVKAKAIEQGIIEANTSYTEAEIVDLIFHPGFSTADQITDVSGRGVGMDVVRRNIKALGGTVDVETTAGVGSIFTIRLPLTLAIMDGQLSQVGSQCYIFPLVSIVESIQAQPEWIKSVTGKELFKLRDSYIPILRLNQQFGSSEGAQRLEEGLLVVVESLGKQVAIFVDDLLGQQQIVIKSLETNYVKIDGIAGATILGNGTVALILDIAELVAKADAE